jgi:hypothetical protein
MEGGGLREALPVASSRMSGLLKNSVDPQGLKPR